MSAPSTSQRACPALMYLDPTGCQRSITLAGRGLVTLGRRPEADICLPWDPGISRLHAEFIERAGEWVVADDGLSQNGTYVNGLPVEGRRRLHDGDLITVGQTNLTFCDPVGGEDVTMALPDLRPMRTYSEQQQQILRCLCSPLLGDGDGVRAASDEQVAADLGLPLLVVTRELDTIGRSFGYGELAVAEKRLRTALTALRSGLANSGDQG